jgi:probable phosphoglycerate mutase
MTVFLLVRHGTTDAVGRRLAGRLPGFPLNTLGLAEVDGLSARLGRTPIAAVYSSPLERAEQTARAIAAPRGLPVVLRKDLNEIDFGQWSGLDFGELGKLPAFRAFNQARSRVRPPEGEHVSEVQARMVRELERIRSAHPVGAVVVVGHGDPLKAALGHYLGVPADLLGRIELSPASLTILRLSVEAATLLLLNDTGASGLTW